MHSSWVQHNTVVAQQTRAFLERMFIEGGEKIELIASRPLLLSDPTTLYFVESGAVDIFMVDVIDQKPTGRRTHFLRVEKGQVLLGVELLPSLVENTYFGLIACGLPNTQLRSMPKSTCRKHAEILRVTDGFNGLIELWIRNLSREINENNVPRSLDNLEVGSAQQVPEGTLFTAGNETLWIYHRTGTLKIAGTSEIKPWKQVIFVPLVRGSWIEAMTDCELTVIGSQEFFERDKNLVSLRRYHRICLDSLARLRLADADASTALIQRRNQSEAESISHSLSSLALFGDEGRAFGPASVKRSTHSIMAVCQKVAQVNGLQITEPVNIDGATPTLKEIASASHIRSREVLLRGNWFKESGSAFVAFTEGIDLPVAILPRKSGGYDLYDPLTDRKTKVTAEVSEALQPHAFELYRPFPRREIKPLDLLKFALRGSGRDILTILVTGLVVGALGMLIPLAMGQVIDNLIPNARSSLLVQMGMALAIVAFANAVISIAQTIATIRIEIRSSSAIQGAVWDRLLGLPVPFFRKYGAGDLAQRAAGIDTIRRALSGSTISLLLSSGFSLMNLFVMFKYDAKLAGIGLMLGLGSVVSALVISLSTVFMRRQLAELEGKLSSLVLQLLTGIQKIRIAGAEDRAFGEWSKIFSEKRSLEYRVGNIVNAFDVLSAIYPIFSTGVIYFMVVESVRSGSLGAGDFLAFNAAFGIFLGGLLSIVGKMVELFELLPVYERAKPIMEAIPEVREGCEHPGELMGDIQISHVTFRYDKEGAPIIDNVDITIRHGEFIALVGTTAAGKSTLMRLMLGFETPESGGVYYDGKSLDTLDISEVRRQFGVVLQNGDLVGGDIFENIVGNRNMTHEDAWEAAEAAGIAEEIRAMPMGMHTVVLQGGGNFSGGQRQRLQIARAIANKPRVIFFDEATSALDNRTQSIVSDSLERLHATRIVVAHRLSTIRNADRIIVLERGRIIQQGTYEELMEVEGEFKTQAERQLV
jgi:NHLM bacteriocin system ABC transporter ATP-binding protein